MIFKRLLCCVLACTLFANLAMAEVMALGGNQMKSFDAFSMPSFFGTDMLFQQNKEMNLWGQANEGDEITGCLLLGGETLETVTATTDAAGEWKISFSPRAASYDSYTVEIYWNGVGVQMFTDVLIGELWLATGQSNMEFQLYRSFGGSEAIQTANDPYLRILCEPVEPSYGENYPAYPAYDVPGSYWGRGDVGTDIQNVSAMAYWAVCEMRKTLDIPVGFINAARGATSIQTWLSRESIEENESLMNYLKKANRYCSLEDFEQGVDIYQMTAAYNAKIGPLAGMNIAGLLWCQGETNRGGLPNEKGYYTEALSALIEGYSKAFGFESGTDMPTMVAHLAAHNYLNDPFNLAYWVEDVTAACERYPNLVQLPLYDATLAYRDPPEVEYYPIHPSDKRVIGQRMGLAAVHNVYGNGKSNYAPAVFESVRFENGRAYVTFRDVGDGLITMGTLADVHGFTICDENRVFVPAQARIISENTVEVWNDGVADPVAVTYAFASFNMNASLGNSFGLPAVPFRSDEETSTYFTPSDWMNCDSLTDWYSDNTNAGEEACWLVSPIQGSNQATLLASTDDKAEGSASLLIQYELTEDSTVMTGVGPKMDAYLRTISLKKYTTMSVLVKNPDDRSKELSLLLTNKKGQVCQAATTMEEEYSYSLNAESGFTRYVFRLDGLIDCETGDSVDISKFNPTQIQFTVLDTQSGSLRIDGIELGFTDPGALSYPFDYQYRYGDINRDGAVDASDALWALQSSVQLKALDAEETALADVDANAKIDASDALQILQHSVKLREDFPAEKND